MVPPIFKIMCIYYVYLLCVSIMCIFFVFTDRIANLFDDWYGNDSNIPFSNPIRTMKSIYQIISA